MVQEQEDTKVAESQHGAILKTFSKQQLWELGKGVGKRRGGNEGLRLTSEGKRTS